MNTYNELNTIGFSTEELEVLNEAHEELKERFPNISASNIQDLINNAWDAGITAEEIVYSVSNLIGE